MSVLYSSVIYMIVTLVGCLMALGSSILFMLAVGADAKAIGVKNRMMWMVLTVFMPISGIIYLCLRNSLEKITPKYCPACGATLPPNATGCMRCGNYALMDYRVADAPKYEKQRKGFLVGGIVVYVLAFLVIIGATIGYTFSVVKDIGDYTYNYSEEFDEDDLEDFFENYEDDMEGFFEEHDDVYDFGDDPFAFNNGD